MSSSLSQPQTVLINEIANKNGIKNYKIEIKRGASKGDGYSGEIIFIDVKDESKERVLHLVLKVAHKGDELRDNLMIGEAYAIENFVYGVVFEEYHNLLKECNVKLSFDGSARYFGGLDERNEECLILEDLTESGFSLWNRRVPMDSHHVGAVMDTYGKFHALSYAMKKLKPKKFELLSTNLQTSFEKLDSKMKLGEMWKSGLESIFHIVKENANETAALKRFAENSIELVNELMKTENKYSVITHGDCWSNNMMFKYEDIEHQKPSKVYLLDWQMSTVCSPLRDLAYFFYACSSKDCLDTYKTYLKIYHDSLNEMLQQFGISVTEMMTFEELEIQWQKFAKYGLQTAILAIKIMLTEQDEVPDVKEVCKDGDIMEMFKNNIGSSEEYERRIRIVIDHMLENGFL